MRLLAFRSLLGSTVAVASVLALCAPGRAQSVFDVTLNTTGLSGGSGYLANSQYELTFATPYEGAYTVSVRSAGGTYTTTAHRGDHVTLRADGTYSIE